MEEEKEEAKKEENEMFCYQCSQTARGTSVQYKEYVEKVQLLQGFKIIFYLQLKEYPPIFTMQENSDRLIQKLMHLWNVDTTQHLPMSI